MTLSMLKERSTLKAHLPVFGLLAMLLLSSCANQALVPAEQLVGSWQTRLNGFPLTVTYTDAQVRLGNGPAVAYTLEGNMLAFAEGGSQVRLLSFPSVGEMHQTDPLTGTVHRFTRSGN